MIRYLTIKIIFLRYRNIVLSLNTTITWLPIVSWAAFWSHQSSRIIKTSYSKRGENLSAVDWQIWYTTQIISNCQYGYLRWFRSEVQTKHLFCDFCRNPRISSWLEGRWWWRKWIYRGGNMARTDWFVYSTCHQQLFIIEYESIFLLLFVR